MEAGVDGRIDGVECPLRSGSLTLVVDFRPAKKIIKSLVFNLKMRNSLLFYSK